MAVKLTKADFIAIENGDGVYLNGKGANFYRQEKYEEAIEYYRLAAAMGNVDSISNLGYCYMYARSVPGNISLALAYFEAAAASFCCSDGCPGRQPFRIGWKN